MKRRIWSGYLNLSMILFPGCLCCAPPAATGLNRTGRDSRFWTCRTRFRKNRGLNGSGQLAKHGPMDYFSSPCPFQLPCVLIRTQHLRIRSKSWTHSVLFKNRRPRNQEKSQLARVVSVGPRRFEDVVIVLFKRPHSGGPVRWVQKHFVMLVVCGSSPVGSSRSTDPPVVPLSPAMFTPTVTGRCWKCAGKRRRWKKWRPGSCPWFVVFK